VPNIGAFGRVACVIMIKELVGCGNQWFSYQVMTYTIQELMDVRHVCRLCVTYAKCLLLEASDALERILFVVGSVKTCINGVEWQ